jgi:short-subunit dehydrogenase
MWPYFSQKKVLITGAGSGLGKQLALELAASARSLILLDIQSQRVKETAQLIGPHAQAYAVDVVDAAAMQKILGQHSDCDIVIANAGLGGVNPATAFSPVVDQQIMSVNYFGTVNTLIPFIAPMLARRNGHLVAIASMAGLRGLPHAASYSASKAAQITLMESLRLDLRPHGIKVSTLLPAFIKTAMTEHQEFQMPFMVPVEKAAQHVIRKISAGARFNLFPWPMACLARLNRLLPVFLYDFVMPLVTKGRSTGAKVFGGQNL